MDLLKKLRKALKDSFPPPDRIKLRDEDGIIGSVTSERFLGLDSIDRQKLLWGILSKDLSPQERQKVVTIITITPYEEVAYLER